MKMKVRVCFRKDKNTNETVAVFPDEIGDSKGNITCYAIIGQHSACSLAWVRDDTVPASRKEAKKMKKHLEGLAGYEDLKLKEIKI